MGIRTHRGNPFVGNTEHAVAVPSAMRFNRPEQFSERGLGVRVFAIRFEFTTSGQFDENQGKVLVLRTASHHDRFQLLHQHTISLG